MRDWHALCSDTKHISWFVARLPSTLLEPLAAREGAVMGCGTLHWTQAERLEQRLVNLDLRRGGASPKEGSSIS